MSPKDLYELEIAHQQARREDVAKRAALRAEVPKRWPATAAYIRSLQAEKGIHGLPEL